MRLIVVGVAIGFMFLAMLARLWYLQVVQRDLYSLQADSNRYRLVSAGGPRGVIYDREGHLLVRNVPRYSVSIVPAFLPEEPVELARVMGRLAEILHEYQPEAVEVPVDADSDATYLDRMPWESQSPDTLNLFDVLAKAPAGAYQPVLAVRDVSREAALLIEEEHLDLPGVLVEVEPVREYTTGALTAHILGYTGPIPEHLAENYTEQGYDPSRHHVGITGLEHSMEGYLRGYDGQRYVEVDVAGREVRIVEQGIAPVPGQNLALTIDLDLQTAMEAALLRMMRESHSPLGVVVALNPNSGEVLGLVSLPSYDNNLFANGISIEAYQALQDDESRPLVNHALAGAFPPGSVIKPIVAAAGLEEDVIDPDTRLNCGGILWLPNEFAPADQSLAQPFYCWIHEAGGRHGSINIVSALAQSCDIFFYKLGGGFPEVFEGLAEDRVGYYAELFGLGQRTNIDLPGEASGLVPDRNWKRVNYRETWVTGDTYNMSIGQGYVLATPLQITSAIAAVANGGTLYRPQLIWSITDSEGNVLHHFEPEVIRQIPVTQESLYWVQEGMRAAVTWGTARNLVVPGVSVAAKTGTAEFFIDRNKDGRPDRDREGNLPTHAWFTAFAPYQNPDIVVTAFVFGGGEGSAVALPVVEEILNHYFQERASSSS
jgi:penicillin-binding protein 2